MLQTVAQCRRGVGGCPLLCGVQVNLGIKGGSWDLGAVELSHSGSHFQAWQLHRKHCCSHTHMPAFACGQLVRLESGISRHQGVHPHTKRKACGVQCSWVSLVSC